jgi:hypothetical protein
MNVSAENWNRTWTRGRGGHLHLVRRQTRYVAHWSESFKHLLVAHGTIPERFEHELQNGKAGRGTDSHMGTIHAGHRHLPRVSHQVRRNRRNEDLHFHRRREPGRQRHRRRRIDKVGGYAPQAFCRAAGKPGDIRPADISAAHSSRGYTQARRSRQRMEHGDVFRGAVDYQHSRARRQWASTPDLAVHDSRHRARGPKVWPVCRFRPKCHRNWVALECQPAR